MKFLALWLGWVVWPGTALLAQDLTDPAAILSKSQAVYATGASCVVTGQPRSDFPSTPAGMKLTEDR